MIPYPLMFHDVVDPGRDDASGFPGRAAARYKLTVEQFHKHLRAIARAVDIPPCLTFDDGGASAIRIADALEHAGWRGAFFVTAAYINRPGFLTRPQLRELRRRGHTIGSHSWTHPAGMAHLAPDALAAEWQRSGEELGGILGERIVTASVPGGSYSRRVADAAAAAGVRILFTSRPSDEYVRRGPVTVIGRYTVRRTTTPERVGAVVSGALLPRIGQLAWWDAKTTVKAIVAFVWGQSDRIRPPHGHSAPA